MVLPSSTSNTATKAAGAPGLGRAHAFGGERSNAGETQPVAATCGEQLEPTCAVHSVLLGLASERKRRVKPLLASSRLVRGRTCGGSMGVATTAATTTPASPTRMLRLEVLVAARSILYPPEFSYGRAGKTPCIAMQ